MKTISLILATFLSIAVSAQEPKPTLEYGRPSELKGVSSVFIEVGLELTVRNNMAEYIERELPKLTIADKIDDAEVILMLVEVSGQNVHFVAIKPTDEGNARLLFELRDTKARIKHLRPSMKFARMFVEEYRKANGLVPSTE